MDEEQHDGEDAATQAFEEVRAEVTLLRRAIERLTAERAERPEPKDYDETLGRIAKAINKLAERMDVLADRPGIKITPEGIARQIAAAGGTTRAEDQRTIAEARGALEKATARLDGITVSARRGDQQNRWLVWAAIGGVIVGMVLWAAFAGIVARAAPANWQWPERMAAQTLDLPRWEAGQRMMQSASPGAFSAIVAGDRIVTANRETIEGCSKAAARKREPVRCTIRVSGNP